MGAEAERGATLTVNSNITLPYEWWGEKITTAISFENLTITGSASNGLYTYQPYFEGIDFKVNNCTLKGIKIYNCANVGRAATPLPTVRWTVPVRLRERMRFTCRATKRLR